MAEASGRQELDRQQFNAVLVRYFGNVSLEDDSRFVDLGLDSIGVIRLVLNLEEEFGVRFDEEQLTGETFDTLESLWQQLILAKAV